MSLREMQRAFCTVLTDDVAREAYLADPAAYLASYDLDGRESRALTGVDVSRLRIYARMLVASRMELALKAFPNARTLLPADFIDRYGPRFSREFPRLVEHETGPLSREFKRLAQFFERLADEGELAGNFLDVMRHDALRYSLANDPALPDAIADFDRRALPPARDALLHGRLLRAPGVIVQAFTHAVTDMPRDRADAAAAPATTPALLLFHRQSASRRLRVFRINALTGRFLDLCDGRHTIHDAARLLTEPQRGNPGDCIQLGMTLASQRVIGVMPETPDAP
jgi:hypothetical protein